MLHLHRIFFNSRFFIRIDSQIAQRIYELENLNANISDNLRVKALIELKALRLLGDPYAAFSQVSHHHHHL